jgi:hypothetical protein
MEHALSSCILAIRLGDALGLSEQELHEVYYLALLNSIGCPGDAYLIASAMGAEITITSYKRRIQFSRSCTLRSNNVGSCKLVVKM